MRRCFVQRHHGRLTIVKAIRTTDDEVRVDKMRVVSDAEMPGSNIAPPILAVHARRYVAQLPGVQCGDAHLRDLVVCSLVRLDINTHEDYGLVKVERRWLLLHMELDEILRNLSLIHTGSIAGGGPPGPVVAAFAVGRRPRYR